MSSPFLGEIRIFSFDFCPRGWAACDGQLLPINQNQALFSLLGNQYGGDGLITFALPNLQGRAPVHRGTEVQQGEAGGEEVHTLTLPELAAHRHTPAGRTHRGDSGDPTGRLWAASRPKSYGGAAGTAISAAAIGPTGSGQPHPNMQPYLVLHYCIALQGVFPSQS